MIRFAAALDTGIVATPGERGYLQRLIREAADVIAGQRRAIEASRVWWDDADPYHAEWNHSSTCWLGHECGACVARRLAMAALAKLGEGG